MKNQTKRDYIICTLGYFKNNGSRVLHNLAFELEKRGYNVRLFSLSTKNTNYKYIDNLKNIDKNRTVVVYPEVISGNPLDAKYVARLVLYYSGVLGGDKDYNCSEIIFVHNRIFCDKGDLLTIPFIDSSLFYKDDTVKNKNCYFVNKGGKWKNIPETEGIIEINMTYPEKREDLAKLLRETKILYSYDDCSAILDEAKMCGCEVKIIRENSFENYKLNYEEMTKNFEEQLNNFIEKTQNCEPTSIEKAKKLNLKFGWILRFIIYKYLLFNKRRAIIYKWKIRGFIK